MARSLFLPTAHLIRSAEASGCLQMGVFLGSEGGGGAIVVCFLHDYCFGTLWASIYLGSWVPFGSLKRVCGVGAGVGMGLVG